MWFCLIAYGLVLVLVLVSILVVAEVLCHIDIKNKTNQERIVIITHINLLNPYKNDRTKEYIQSKYSPWLITHTKSKLQSLMGTNNCGMPYTIERLEDNDEKFFKRIDTPWLVWDPILYDYYQRHKKETSKEYCVIERYRDIFYLEYILGNNTRIPMIKDTNLLISNIYEKNRCNYQQGKEVH